MIRGDLLLNAWWTIVLVALVPGILVAADYSLWLLPLIGIPLVAIQLGSRQAVINEHEARHDRVTGLSNREDVARVLERSLHRAARQGWQVGVLMIGLERFKEINETLGHRRGDLVLAEVARRLSEVAGARDVAARLGGDEFALILGRVSGVDECVAFAERALASLAVPVMIRGVELDVGATAGIACHPEHGVTFDALLRHADVALSRAKSARHATVVYSEAFDEHGVERLTLVSELGRAIDAGELQLVFQPQIELATGRLRAVEALVRWPHPERGELSPEAFIEPAEHTGVIRRLTLWVIQAALSQADRWRADGLDLRVAVNLSVRSITPELPRDLAIILEGRSGDQLELEITETVGMVDAEGSLAVLEELRSLGIRLAIDDFGTGFSSLAYLKQLPVSAIKIDRSFVMEMDSEASDRAIVRSTVDLARHLGMEVVAEGVESEAAMAELRALGCHLAQGFAISPPLGAEALAAWAAQGRAA
jgi:diguanylate cyclase (GGDEF)-like protein